MHSDKVSTTASENRDRKKAKPMMEKRRRARMNASLAELKSLLLEVIKREGARHSKMEKADILEMTVKHLKEMQRKPFTGTAKSDTNTCSKQRLGFNECAQEVSRYLSTMDGCDVDLRARLLDHLANCVTSVGSTGSSEDTPSVSPVTPEPSVSPREPATTGTGPNIPPCPDHSSLPTDLNNNVPTIAIPQPVQPTQVFNGLQVIPTKLQTGEIAFVLPANVVGGSQIPNCIIPVYSPSNTSPVKVPSPAQSGVPNSGSVIVMPSPTFIHSGGPTNVPVNLNLVTSNAPSLPSSVFPGFSVMSVPSSLKLETQDSVEQSRDHHRHVRDLRTQQPEEDNSVWRPW